MKYLFSFFALAVKQTRKNYQDDMQYSFTILLIVVALSPIAQKPMEASATYEMQLSRTGTMEQTEAQCIEQARLKAVGDAFGYAVSETTLGNVSDRNGQATSDFTVLTKTNVQGEWLNDTQPPGVKWICRDNELFVQATVYGKIREQNKSGKTDVEFFTCKPSDVKTEQSFFKDGQDLNCSFRAARKGYLSVFYVDYTSGEVFRLLPSSAYTSLDYIKVGADETYILFNKRYAKQFPDNTQISDINVGLPAGKTQVIDEIIAVYSTEEYKKPLMSKPSNSADLPVLSISDFNLWKTTLKQRDKEAVIKTVAVTITK